MLLPAHCDAMHFLTVSRESKVAKLLPGLLSFKKLLVGGDLNVQGQFDVHELLVLADLAGHVLFGSLQGVFQVSDASLGVLHCQLTALLSLSDLGLQVGTLGGGGGGKVSRGLGWDFSQTSGLLHVHVLAFFFFLHAFYSLQLNSSEGYFGVTCPLTASISFWRRLIMRLSSAISFLVLRRSSPAVPADVCISWYWRNKIRKKVSLQMPQRILTSTFTWRCGEMTFCLCLPSADTRSQPQRGCLRRFAHTEPWLRPQWRPCPGCGCCPSPQWQRCPWSVPGAHAVPAQEMYVVFKKWLWN